MPETPNDVRNFRHKQVARAIHFAANGVDKDGKELVQLPHHEAVSPESAAELDLHANFYRHLKEKRGVEGYYKQIDQAEVSEKVWNFLSDPAGVAQFQRFAENIALGDKSPDALNKLQSISRTLRKLHSVCEILRHQKILALEERAELAPEHKQKRVETIHAEHNAVIATIKETHAYVMNILGTLSGLENSAEARFNGLTEKQGTDETEEEFDDAASWIMTPHSLKVPTGTSVDTTRDFADGIDWAIPHASAPVRPKDLTAIWNKTVVGTT